jgi:hypothetical protein
MRRLSLLPLVLLPLLTGCQLPFMIIDAIGNQFADDPPRVNTPDAREARSVRSPATPATDLEDPIAVYGPEDDRDTNELDDLDDEADLGHVGVTLQPGRYALWDTVLINGAKTFVLEGKGSHKSRLELHSEDMMTLRIKGADRVVLRGFTVAGYLGGGIFLDGVKRVEVEDVHFVSCRFGLELRGSNAIIKDSVFVGCDKGVGMRAGAVELNRTVFADNYTGIAGKGAVKALATAFVDNHTAVAAALNRQSAFVSCLFAGDEQEVAWKGRPRTVVRNLAHRRDLGRSDKALFHPDGDNREIKNATDFPEQVRLPRAFLVASVHMALVRFEARSSADPEVDLADVAFDGAERYAKAAQKALKAQDVDSARAAVKIALAYWGERPLTDAPQDLVDLADLGRDP